MGASAAPTARVARSAKAHSGRFSARIATLSPLATPRSRKPRESSSTAVRNSSELMARQAPSLLCLRCSAFRKVETE